MKIPVMRGIIDRRILVNYRVDPDVLARTLPPPFRPKTVRGFGMAGICLIRLKNLRPSWAPAWIGIESENAAHRTAVVWNDAGPGRDGGAIREGVYVRRRDSDSRLNALAGGRLFPGIHHHARFQVRETSDRFEVALKSDDLQTQVSVVGFRSDALPKTSIFPSLAEASAFFQAGAIGYSETPDPSAFQGMELRCNSWQVEPLRVESVSSSFFEDRSLFPEASIQFDCALLMRGLDHEWRGQVDLCCKQAIETQAGWA